MARYASTPVSYNNYIKANKKYEILDLNKTVSTHWLSRLAEEKRDECFIAIIEGREVLCLYKGCYHLNGNDWEITEE